MLSIIISKEKASHSSTIPFFFFNKALEKEPHIRIANYRDLGGKGHQKLLITLTLNLGN